MYRLAGSHLKKVSHNSTISFEESLFFMLTQNEKNNNDRKQLQESVACCRGSVSQFGEVHFVLIRRQIYM